MFGINKKSPPKITTTYFDLLYNQKYEQWEIKYKNTEFIFNGNEIEMPSESSLDQYLSWIESHKEHIDKNVKEMVEGWEDVFIDTSKAHIASVEVESSNKITVMILGDETWGDLGYDLWLEDGKIVNEGFAD